MTAAGILLMALLSSLLLPAPSLGLALAQNWSGSFILWISTSFILCCFVYGFCCSARWNIMSFALSGGAGFRWPINISMRTTMLFFTISAWRQVERAGKCA
ncbi:hypothetical protein SEEE2558_12879 [Salmonella enterica subsp. enterica serovar Enteritidis str. 22558]|nr:hypothetical protein SEEE2558_12879 [Salmonella enterica subsp. enterica serovar Enteritidis str. 22558]